MATPPPWILLLFLVAITRSDEISSTPSNTTMNENYDANTTLIRSNRGTPDRERRLVQQYPTYFLAHSYTDEAGERRNVLIPVQAGPTTEAPQSESPSTASPTPTATADYSNAYSSSAAQLAQNSLTETTNPLLAHAMLLRLQSAGLFPSSQTPTSDYAGNPSSALVYAYRPQSKFIKPQHPLQYPPTHNLKYGLGSAKINPYTSHKLQYKSQPVTKLYSLDTQHRFRPRPRPDKNKYTATKLQFSINTTPSPYHNKVRFELEDARVPMAHSIALLPVSMPQTTPHPLTQSTVGGLSQYLEPEMPKQYYAQHRPQIQYIQVPQRESFEARPQPSPQPQIEPQQIQYIHGNDIGPSTEAPSTRPDVQYTQSTPSPSTRPATLQQHYAQNEQSNPGSHQQIQYVSVTDIEVGSPSPSPNHPQQEVQYVRIPESSSSTEPPQQIQYVRVPEDNRQQHDTQYSEEEQLHHVQYVDSNRPSPQPQINFASDNGDLRASPQPQVDYVAEGGVKSTVEPQIQYHDDGPSSNELPEDPHIEYTPTTPSHIQYVTQSGTMRTPSHHHQVQYQQDTNDVTPTPQPQYHYVTETNQVTPTPQPEVPYEPPKFPPAVQDAYNILKETNQLPQSITPDNIDGSIKTLALILQKLQQAEKIHKYRPTIAPVIVKPKQPTRPEVGHPSKEQSYPQSSGGSTPGKPGIDYPVYSKIPKTSFDCSTQRYKGFFGDPETHCQVWHYCDLNGGQASFLCPNGTIFNQVALTCDWWFNVRCSSTSQLYVLNERLYKYILPFSPSFPEDYSGPLVDRYLTAKFKEQEAKNKIKALKALITTPAPDDVSPSAEATTETSI